MRIVVNGLVATDSPPPSCEVYRHAALESEAVMLFKHCDRRAHLPCEQMQIGATVHNLKCLIQRRLYKVRF